MTTPESPIESIIFLDARGEEKPTTVESFCHEELTETPYWLHFSIKNPIASNWLKNKSGVDPLLVESMLSQKVRPKASIHSDSLLLILRVADTLKVSEHEELRSLRMYVDRHRIISTSHYPLPVVKELTEVWKEKSGKHAHPVNIFVDLTVQSVRGLEVILEDIEDQADSLERQVLDVVEDPDDHDIANLALDALDLRRYLAPQREVVSRLADIELAWLNTSHKKRLKGVYDRVSRQLDETEVIRDRIRIIREQRSSHVAEQANRRLYIFSIATVVFLPLSFFTGLLGVNLGGIPGADSPLGFYGFCSMLTVFTLTMILAFRRFSWL